MNEWQEAGKPIRSFGTMSAMELKRQTGKTGEVLLLDVRDPPEWVEDGYIEGAKRIFFADLTAKAGSLPKDKPIAVTCSVGNRSSIGAQRLESGQAFKTSATYSAASPLGQTWAIQQKKKKPESAIPFFPGYSL